MLCDPEWFIYFSLSLSFPIYKTVFIFTLGGLRNVVLGHFSMQIKYLYVLSIISFTIIVVQAAVLGLSLHSNFQLVEIS